MFSNGENMQKIQAELCPKLNHLSSSAGDSNMAHFCVNFGKASKKKISDGGVRALKVDFRVLV